MNTVLLIASLSVIGLAALALTVKTKLDQAWAGGFQAGFQAAQRSVIGNDRRGGVKDGCLVPPKDGYSRTYEEALRLATQAHRDQNRKGCDVPYITHPVQVSIILAFHGFPIEVVIAGLLHGIVEDCGYELRRIAWRFGERVSGIVDALSEHKVNGRGKKRPWGERKWEALERLRQADDEVAAVKAADTLHNARCIAMDVRQEGPKVWKRFSRGPESIMAYYREVHQIAYEKLGYCSLVRELEGALEDLRRVIEEVEVDVDDEDAYVGVDDQLRDQLERIWFSISPRPRVIGDIPADVPLRQEVIAMNVVD
jgi:(p)ppGpp synthase/HD superfamily hydrolase